MSETYVASQPISHECQDQFRHYACNRHRSAWDPILDRPTDCVCWCHLAADRISVACQDTLSHHACAREGAAWSVLTDKPSDCECECHGRCG